MIKIEKYRLLTANTVTISNTNLKSVSDGKAKGFKRGFCGAGIVSVAMLHRRHSKTPDQGIRQ